MLELNEILILKANILAGAAAFVLFFYFLKKLSRVKGILREFLPFLGLILTFLFASITYFIQYWIFFYPFPNSTQITQTFLLSSWVSFFFICEHRLNKTRYLITLYAVLGLTGATIAQLYNVKYAGSDIVGIIMIAPLLFAYPYIFYKALIQPTSGYLRNRMYFVLLGLILVFFLAVVGVFNSFFGVLLDPYLEFFKTTIGFSIICLMGYGLAAFSTLSDFEWKEKLRNLFVISESGICLYAYSFERNLTLMDSDLIASGFSGIQQLLSEMVKTTESLQLIDYQNLKIMIEQGTKVMCVLVIKDESSFLQYKLKEFTAEFHRFFSEILTNWVGNIEVFKPTRALIQKVFLLDASSAS